MHHAVAAFAGSYVNVYLVNEHAPIITGEPHVFLAGAIFYNFKQICHVFIMISPLIAGIIGVRYPMMIVSGKDLRIFSLSPKNKVSSLKMLDRAYHVITAAGWGAGGVRDG
jgi:hypothetical protein